MEIIKTILSRLLLNPTVSLFHSTTLNELKEVGDHPGLTIPQIRYFQKPPSKGQTGVCHTEKKHLTKNHPTDSNTTQPNDLTIENIPWPQATPDGTLQGMW